jgi:hypothetical protein
MREWREKTSSYAIGGWVIRWAKMKNKQPL